MKDVNKIIFDFIWMEDKVKRSALISDIKDSIAETQRVLCCKKLASNQLSNWKDIVKEVLYEVRCLNQLKT